jgi:hypothetical protein
VPYSSLTAIDFYLQEVKVDTDISVFPFSNIVTVSNVTFTEHSVFVNIPYAPGQTEFIKCFLRLSNSQLVVSRTVQSLEEFLSFLGGMFSMIQLLGIFVLTPYSRCQFLLKVYNELGLLSRDVPPDSSRKMISERQEDYARL